MRITRIYTGDDGRSHFEELELRLDDVPSGRRSAPLTVRPIDFRETPERHDGELHNASDRQFVITLEGRLEVELGDGTKGTFGPGDVFFAEDLEGEGHISRHLDGTRRSVVIPVADDFDLDSYRA